MSGITVNGVAITLSTIDDPCAIDTGTTLIGGPGDVVRALYAAIPRSQKSSKDGFFAFRKKQTLVLFPSSLIYCRSACSTIVNISISFGGQLWPIDPQDFNIGEDPSLRSGSDRFCVGAFFDLGQGTSVSSNGPVWIIGDTFLVRNILWLHSCPSDLDLFLEKCVLGVPFQPTVYWICSVVYCGWWIRCGMLWDSFELIYTDVCLPRNSFRWLFFSYFSY